MAMNISRSMFGMGALFSTFLAASPAFAGTFYCDNDRSASQYPNCSTPGAPGWAYGGGSGDRNGDHRRQTSGHEVYYWDFNGVDGRKFELRVYLNNVLFTDPSARYYRKVGFNIDGIGNLNQNTAPGGWSYIGVQTVMSTSMSIGVNAYGVPPQGVTGADEIWVYSVASLAATDIHDDAGLCASALVADPKIVSLQQKMLDATDHYRDVKGTFDIAFSNNGQNQHVDFTVSESLRSSSVRITDQKGSVVEHVSNGRNGQVRHPDTSSFETSSLAPVERPVGARQFFTNTCEPVYVHRQDPAWAGVAEEVTSPQNYAFWLTAGQAKITGTERLLGRTVTVVEGLHDAYLSTKLGAAAFKMWVDDETGVLLKLVGTKDDGTVAYSIDVTNIQFNRGVDAKAFAMDAPAGWKNLTLQAK
ncbi:hypothetical protein LZC95_51895 [Pendulispora brunnea]|uniref:Uncharacterized protein n=1 Tax=Pendulispora brunnea TaxID=2905690 RepID=A0ABZ2KBI0_9BACT